MPEAKRKPRSQPAWTDIKARLAGFDRRGLMGLIQDLYAAHKENRSFLHARFGVGSDALRPYKETLDRWLWPDVLRNQHTSVAKAKKPKVSGKHQSPRHPVNLPGDWGALAAKLARQDRQTLVWWLVDLIHQKALAKGETKLPRLPWE